MNGTIIVWLVVALIFGIIEASTGSLVSVWVAAAAVILLLAVTFKASTDLHLRINRERKNRDQQDPVDCIIIKRHIGLLFVEAEN